MYLQELAIGAIGLSAAIVPLVLPYMKPLYRFLLIAASLLAACSVTAFLASFFFKADFTTSFIRAFLMIGILQNMALRIPAYPK